MWNIRSVVRNPWSLLGVMSVVGVALVIAVGVRATRRAATLLVDTFHRLGRHDEMLATIDSLVANPKFLHGKSDPWLGALRDHGIPLH